MTEKSTSALACESLRDALVSANERIERLETDVAERDILLRGLTDRGPLLVLLQGQAEAKIAEIRASASVKEKAIEAFQPAAAPLLGLITRGIDRFCGKTSTPSDPDVGTAIMAIMSDSKLTAEIQRIAGDKPWMAFLDLMQKIVGGAAVPETVASRYHEARTMHPDMMPLAAFTVAAIEAELARRGTGKMDS